MLLPDVVHPNSSIFYNGAQVLRALQAHGKLNLIDLREMSEVNGLISMPLFILSLDWLFLIGAIELSADGEVNLCS